MPSLDTLTNQRTIQFANACTDIDLDASGRWLLITGPNTLQVVDMTTATIVAIPDGAWQTATWADVDSLLLIGSELCRWKPGTTTTERLAAVPATLARPAWCKATADGLLWRQTTGELMHWVWQEEQPPQAWTSHVGPVIDAVAIDQNQWVTIGTDRRLVVWPGDQARPISHLTTAAGRPTAMAYDPTQQRLALATRAGTILVY